MASIRPLRGLRYSASDNLDSLIAPPYDVLSPAQRDEYAGKDPHNIVHLTLPEAKPDDRSKYVKYARSAAALAEWRREDALQPEQKPAIYRYTQRFRIPGTSKELERTAFIALLKLEPFEAGVVLPHEFTFPKHKEDRLRILEATRAHLETIFGLYEDPSDEVRTLLLTAPAETTVTAEDDGIATTLDVISDPAAVAAVQKAMQDKRIWIADGHHRYETALAFRQAIEESGERAEDYIPIAFTSMSDPGLVLLPTHRIIESYPKAPDDILEQLELKFDLSEVDAEKLVSEIEPYAARGEIAFGLILEGGQGYVAVPKDASTLADSGDPSSSQALRALDVSILHDAILTRWLGIKGLDGIKYTRDEAEAIEVARAGAAMVWLMNPPTVEDMKTIALGGERMPQKSTYYFPKVQSGFVLWSLNDF